MKIYQHLDCYNIRFNEITESEEIKVVSVEYNLINSRTTTITLVFSPKLCKIYEVQTNLSLDMADLSELADLRFIVLSKNKEYLTKLVPPMLQFWEYDEFLLMASLRSKEKIEVRKQLRNILEHEPNFEFRSHARAFKEIDMQLQLIPMQEMGIPYFTFSEFLKTAEAEKFTSKEKGTGYARMYQIWRSQAKACLKNNVRAEYVFSSGEKCGQPVFNAAGFIMEKIIIQTPVYMGSSFDDKRVVYCTFHSHEHDLKFAGPDRTDIVLFNFLDKGMLVEQWVVYTDPNSNETPDFSNDLFSILRTRPDWQSTEFRLAEQLQPIQSSPETGYYLIPKIGLH
ncbi:hypothetical protein [Paenibacillus sp. FSL K6-2859]|uniref:hypothetical protein n=1 Tax=Paenibacillus sp. FSL K6-2859 TaxID=2921482 RepID=UPI0030FB077F